MKRREALDVLGLPENATQDAIDAARQALMKVVHPEGSAPDEELAKRINEAHRVARETTPRTDIVPVALMVDVVSRNTAALEKAERSHAAEATVAQVVTHHVGQLAHARRQRSGTAAIAGLTGAVVALTRTIPNLFPNETVAGTLTAMGGFLIVIGAVIGVLAFLSKTREEQLKLQIQDAADTLADRGTLVAALDEIGVEGTWTRAELEHAVRRWLHGEPPADVAHGEPLAALARRIGSVDFARLLLAKGRETGVIEDVELERDGRATYGYELVRRRG